VRRHGVDALFAPGAEEEESGAPVKLGIVESNFGIGEGRIT